jgi:hypothetical protein
MADEYVIHDSSASRRTLFTITQDSITTHSGFTWMNQEDFLIGTETILSSIPGDSKSNIIKIDLNGRVIKKLYEAEKGELAWPLYTSWDDRYLLFTSGYVADPHIYPFEGLSPMVSLVIMDLNSEEIILKIDSLGRLPNLEFEESPWLHDNQRFVFSVGDNLMLETSDTLINPINSKKGIYLFDIADKTKKIIISEGRSAVVSPDGNLIAFEKNNSIRILNFDTGMEKILYEYGDNVIMHNKHWTPDGDHIYFTYKYKWGFDHFFYYNEKLIDVNSGNEVAFQKLELGYNSFSWK